MNGYPYSTGTAANPGIWRSYSNQVGSGVSLNQSCVANSIASISANNAVTQDVGTGFGEATGFNTSQVSFIREDENNPTAILAMYYNTAKNLQKMGIQLRSKNNVGYSPNPFPAVTGTGCVPPTDWVK
jgi:hypothetical protein